MSTPNFDCEHTNGERTKMGMGDEGCGIAVVWEFHSAFHIIAFGVTFGEYDLVVLATY